MRQTHSVEARQQQSQRIDPRQILASEILSWTTTELEAAVERELAENPALEARDEGDHWHPREGTGKDILSPALLLGAGTPAFDRAPVAPPSVEWEEDPLDRIAQGRSLRDSLRDQVGQVADGIVAEVTRYLIEWVDERGYLAADLDEVADRFHVPPSCVEEGMGALQSMDPPGVGARDVRECLRIQIVALDQAGEAHPLARRIVFTCWEDLVAHREERIAGRLRAPVADVRAALCYLRTALSPYPGATFRGGAGARGVELVPPVRPDIIYHRTEAGFAVEIARDYDEALTVAPMWKHLSERGGVRADESLRRYIREHVERAQIFLSGLTRRGRTLRLIAHTLAHIQQGFLETGNRAFLRPLTRQTLSEELELDESVISRAVAEKWAQLPGGEIVPLDAFFGNSHAVREALVALIEIENPQEPFSDDEIADRLIAGGFPLARRTVAKYRALEKILPARLRRRDSGAGNSYSPLAPSGA